jgi:hypothetical protein
MRRPTSQRYSLDGRRNEMADVTVQEKSETASQVDPAQMNYAMDQLRSQQNLIAGSLAGLGASLVGAGLWAVVTVMTGYQIGWMAVGIGFAVGFAMRLAGKGIDTIYGVIGASLAFLGCAVGNLFAVCAMVARQESMAFMDVMSQLDVSLIRELMVATFSPMDLLFYGIAIYEGYKLSFRQVSQQDLSGLLPGR